MASIHPQDYWLALAQQLDAESRKAAVYVSHRASLGAAREAILRKLITAETPGPFKVKTGLIREQEVEKEPRVSRQCDLLIYNPHSDPPLYRMEDFVVVDRRVASAVIEVKSNLENKEFTEIIQVWKAARWCRIPVFGFAYEGIQFSTFLEYLRKAINTP
jgi:hypothetical protein